MLLLRGVPRRDSAAVVSSQAGVDLREPDAVHDAQAEEGQLQVKLPEPNGRCSKCARMRPLSRMDKGTCLDTKGCGKAEADLRRVLAADKEWNRVNRPPPRDHWE